MIANLLLNAAKSMANSRNKSLQLVLRDNSIEYEFTSKNSSDERVYEDHYDNAVIYIKDSAVPCKLEIDPQSHGRSRVVDVLENAVTTKYYKTFMQQEALSRMFQVTGPKHDQILKLLYVIGGGLVITIIMLIAMYGG